MMPTWHGHLQMTSRDDKLSAALARAAERWPSVLNNVASMAWAFVTVSYPDDDLLAAEQGPSERVHLQ
jgi:hypothetical protein